MKRIAQALTLVCLLAAALSAQTVYANKIGGTTFYSGPGVSGTSTQMGNSTYTTLNGQTTIGTTMGGTTFYNGGFTGTSQRIGNSTVITDSYTNQQTWATPIGGGTTLYNGGVNGSSTRIGGTTYYNIR